MAEQIHNQTGAHRLDAGSAVNPPLLVLYVDDNPDDQILVDLACKQAGVPIETHPAESANEAIAYLNGLLNQSRTEAVAWPDLVLLDLVMPERVGFDLLTHLRAIPAFQRLPVIAFTGDVNPALMDEAYRLGANSCLRKPLTFTEMVQMARALYQAWVLAQRPSPPRAA